MNMINKYALVAVLVVIALAGAIVLDTRYQGERAAQVSEKFQLLASLRKSALDTYLNTAKAEVSFWSVSGRVQDSMLALSSGWMQLGVDPGAEVRELYIEQNKVTNGGFGLLENAGDGSPYSLAHAELHAFAREFVTERGYYDFFLIDMDGNIVYTVEKENDFGTNLAKGTYAATGLGKLFARVTADVYSGDVLLSDFEAYAPSNDAPAIFAGTLMRDGGGRELGVLALQLPSDTIQNIMRFTEGMGESGETYLVGQDRLMRSNSRFSDESTVLKIRVDTETVVLALAGERGVDVVADYRGIDVLSAYDYLDFDGHRWAIMAEIDSSEAEQLVGSIFSELLAAALAIVALLLGTVWTLRDFINGDIGDTDSGIDLDVGS